MKFPSIRLRIALLGYAMLWLLGLPIILLYLLKRSIRDPDYRAHLRERFGFYKPFPDAVWIHAVSLGEMRSATPLVRALLDRGDRVVTTHFTPAGRREAETVFAAEIADGRFRPVWVPFEYGFAFRGFMHMFRPRYGLVMEIEIWPRMIMSARAASVPLFMCNAQYPLRSYEKDRRHLGLRSEIMRGFAGAFVKSDLQAARFASVGVSKPVVTGELRFDQPVPPPLCTKGQAARAWLASRQAVVTIASTVEGEDAAYIGAIREILDRPSNADAPPLFIYVPRAPERFDETATLLGNAGLRVARRSELFDGALNPRGAPPEFDVLLGDSMGEMYFYLALADKVVVGGGFVPKGAHNIIEPLALKKPVIVGPETWTIEYPVVEAIKAGVVLRLERAEQLAAALDPASGFAPDADRIDGFFDAHSGAVLRTLVALDAAMAR